MKKNEEYLDPDIIADLEAIENDETYDNIPMSEDMGRELFAKIKEYEEAEEIGDIEKIQEICASVGVDMLTSEVVESSDYSQLSEEDQQALRLGKELLRMNREHEEKSNRKVRKFGKKKKVLLLVAIMGVMMAGMGIVSVGHDMRWLVSEEKKFEENIGVVVDSDVEKRLEVIQNDEVAAYELANEVIGVSLVRLVRVPGMEFDKIEMIEDVNIVYLYYTYNGDLLKYSVMTNKNKSSYFEINKGEVIDEYVIDSEGVEINVQVCKDTGREISYVSYTYNNVSYFIMATMEQEMLNKMLLQLYFL